MERMSENKKYLLGEYGYILLEVKDRELLYKLLTQLNKTLSTTFRLHDDASKSSYKYFEDFLLEISYSLTHNELYVAFVKINRLFYHHPTVNIKKKWWELGNYGMFV